MGTGRLLAGAFPHRFDWERSDKHTEGLVACAAHFLKAKRSDLNARWRGAHLSRSTNDVSLIINQA